MTDSLRDQLLGLGFKPLPKADKNDKPAAAQKPRQERGRGERNADRSADRSARKPDGQRKPEGRARAGQAPGKPQKHKKPQTREEIDLAKAYAIRAQREKEERIEAERLKQEEARKRRDAKAKLAELVKDKGLNDPNAEVARHFPYGGKIKRIYVNDEQLKRLNAGELGVIQLDGRYLLVDAALLAEAEAIFPPAIALKVDPNATAGEDPYADPQYQVPDDLVW